MSTLIDRVKIFAASSGNGPFVLGPNVPGFRGSSALTDGETYSYAVEQGAEFEAGTAEYVLSTNTLVRNPSISSNGGAAVAFQANAQIAFTALARDYAAQSADTLREELESAGGASMIGTGGGPTVEAALAGKQATLVSGTTIKTVGGTSLVGAGNVGSTVGGNLLTLTNPSAITFPRFNADNTVTPLNALDFRTAIGAAGGGSVSSVAALTLGTTGTDLSSTVANGTTTPVITLNVPTASATARGVVTPALFNAWQAKQDPFVSGTTIKTVNSSSLLGSGNLAVQDVLVSGTNIKTVGGTTLLGSGNVGSTVGGNLLTLTNPSAITFPRFNADNTVSTLTAAAFITAIGAVDTGSTQTVTGVKTFTTPVLANTAAGTVAGRLGYSGGAVSYGDGSVQRVVVNTDETQSIFNKNLQTVSFGPGPAPLASLSGTAPVYCARAWVNFNGTNTVAILASGNISSITDNGTGDYTLNFTTALPNAEYAYTTGVTRETSGFGVCTASPGLGDTKTTSAFRIRTGYPGGSVGSVTPTPLDFPSVCVHIIG